MSKPSEAAIIPLVPQPAAGSDPAGSPPTPAQELAMTPMRLFMETVEQSPVAISITDHRADIIYVNRAFSRITGYTAEEAIGKNESMLSDQHTPPRIYEELWNCISKKQTWNGTLVNRHKTDGRYLADVTIAPILGPDGEVTHYVGIHRDVTDFYGLEQKVKNQKKLIETVVDSIPVAAVLLDGDGKVILDNQVYKGLTSDLGIVEPIQFFLGLLRDEMGERWA
jgi:nitrogen fixation negative regulator NifL